jgi:DHA1 family inner membrane transport protein
MSSLALRPALVLFIALFAAQAGFLTLGLILPAVAEDHGMTTAQVGQLRTLSGISGGFTAIALVVAGGRVEVRRLLLTGLAVMAGSSALSALAPSFAALALAQGAVGVAIAILLSAGIAAVAEWTAPARRARVLSWAMVGQPAAWVVGMPAIGALADASWRWAFALPLAGSLVALALVAARPADAAGRAAGASGLRDLVREPEVAAWAFGELMAYAAWSGIMVYSGSLFLETYGASAGTVGLILGFGALAYFPSTFLAGRHVDAHARELLIGLALALAACVTVFGLLRTSLPLSAALFAACVFFAGGRTISGSALGLQAARERAVTITSVRTAATQFGNLLGAGLGGVALAAGGYGLAGALFGVLLVLAVVPHLLVTAPARSAAAQAAASA